MKKIAALVAFMMMVTPGYAWADETDTNTTSERQAARQARISEGGPLRNARVWIGGPRIPGPTQNQAYLEDPGTVEVWSVTPLNAIAGLEPFFPRLWAWQESRSLTRCFFGNSTVLGPYGTYTHYKNRGGCTP